MERQRQRVAGRLFTPIPPARHVCFYPMNKRRGETLNWYSEAVRAPRRDDARARQGRPRVRGQGDADHLRLDRLRRLGVGRRSVRRRPADLQEADLRDAVRRGQRQVRRVRPVLCRPAVPGGRARHVSEGRAADAPRGDTMPTVEAVCGVGSCCTVCASVLLPRCCLARVSAQQLSAPSTRPSPTSGRRTMPAAPSGRPRAWSRPAWTSTRS